MKVIALFSFLILTISCKESPEQTFTSGLTKFVGAKIPNELAEQWRGNYQRKYSGLRAEASCSIEKEIFATFVAGLGDYTGIHFSHAIDDTGGHRIVILPEQRPALTTNFALDATSSTLIENSLAKVWAKRYADLNPWSVRSHFFGSIVIESILSKSSFERLEIVEAISDDEKPMLLLYAWNSFSFGSGRIKAESADVYDRANPCPPYCSDN